MSNIRTNISYIILIWLNPTTYKMIIDNMNDNLNNIAMIIFPQVIPILLSSSL